MAQVTGRKVATTPIVPTPSGGGNVINSWNTSDNKETNAPSMKIVKDGLDEINDNLAQTTITVGGETLSTIDEKLNFLCNGGGNDKITSAFLSSSSQMYGVTLNANQMPEGFYLYCDKTNGNTSHVENSYINITTVGQSGTWARVTISAKLAGKYKIKGFSSYEDTIVDANVNDTIFTFSSVSGHNLPYMEAYPFMVQYLGNN